MSWLNLGNNKDRKYNVGDIVEDKWGRKGKIIALRGCSCCGQLYEVENIPGYIVEGNLKGKVIEEYNLTVTYDDVYGGKGTRTYQIENYDGNKQKLKEFIDKKNEESGFWVTWRIINDEIGIIEQEFDPLD